MRGWSRRETKTAELHTHQVQGWIKNICVCMCLYKTPFPSMNHFPLVGSKSSWLYNIPDAHENVRGHIFFSLAPTQCTWLHFLLACNQQSLCGIYTRNTCILFTLDTRSISCYFHSKCLTFTAALTCQRGLQVNIQR